MLATRVTVDALEFDDPDSTLWQQVTAQKVSLLPAPVVMQSSKYIAGKWQDGEFGKVSALGVQALHNSHELAFRLEWEDSSQDLAGQDNDEFADAAALLFPLSANPNQDSTSLLMGLEGAPVNIWHWRADHPDHARNNVAAGIGTSTVTAGGGIGTKALYRQGRWSVVFRRALQLDHITTDSVEFTVGQTINMAFAVWDGGNAERGGLKSFSPTWQPVTLAR